MAFEGFDVEAQPERRADLTAFGVQRVPATIVGERVVHGWNPQALAELVGVRYRAAKKLTPAELALRMDVVLDATQRAGAWFEENAPPEMVDGDAVARYGETVRQRLRAYFARPGWCDGEVSTYYGPQSAPEFMERTTWHSAQHLRQIYWFLDEMGVEKDAPLTDADLEGLPFPKEVWS